MTSHDHLRQGITWVARLRKLLWLPDKKIKVHKFQFW